MDFIPFLHIGIPMGFIAVAVGLIAIIVRDRTPEQRVRLLARVVQWGAWGFSGVATIVMGKEIARRLWSASVPVRIEVSPFWPTMPPEVTATMGSASVDPSGVGDGFSQAAIHLIGLSEGARLLLALDEFAVLVAIIVTCFLIVRLARGVQHGNVFEHVRARELVIAGGVFFVTAVTSMLANGFAHSAILSEASPRQISFETIQWTGSATDGHSDVFGVVSWSWSIEMPTWIWAASALAFIAALVVRRGNQLERDTEGLI